MKTRLLTRIVSATRARGYSKSAAAGDEFIDVDLGLLEHVADAADLD